MSTLGPYLAYKDSGVEWLGQVPEHWEVRRTSAFCRLQNRDVRETDRTVTAFRDGQVTLRSKRRTDGFTEALQEIGYQGVREGDLVIHSMDGFAGAIGVSDSDGKMSPVAHLYQVELGEARYYAFLLRVAAQSGFIESLAKGIRERSTSFDRPTFKTMLLPVPPGSEQVEILDFLDRETAEIDEFVAESEKLITLLNERRAAVITQAVTKGLDPTAPMKDTGIEWLGQVPSHWEISRVRNVAEPIIGLTYSPEDVVDEGDGGTLVLRAGNIQSSKLTFEDNVFVSSEIPVRLRLRQGDLVICARNGSPSLIGKNALATSDVEGQTWGAFMVVLRSEVSQFLAWILGSRIFTASIGQFATSTVNQLTTSTLNDLRFALPPGPERAQISAYLSFQTAKIDEAIATAREAIALAKERRQALISAAVTGKIDVRSAP